MKKHFACIFLMAAMLTVILDSCKQEQPDWSTAITFANPAAQNLQANGYDTVRLTAHIGPNSDPDKRIITFSTDYGIFTNGQASISIGADASGNATTAIRGTVVAAATVKATVQTNFTATKSINFTPADPLKVFQISPPADGQPADGVTTTALQVTLNKQLLYATQNVVYTSDGGTFGNNTATVTVASDPNGNAVAYLKSSTAGTIHVTIANNGISQIIPVNFVRALPEYLLLNAAASLTSGYNNSMTISINGKRNTGAVSSGLLYNYSATDNSGNGVGQFINGTATDSSGNATVSFTMGGSAYKGPVTITIALQQNLSVKAQFTVQII